jgi:hypothetical protein
MKSYEELEKVKIFINNRKDTSSGIYVGRGSVLGNPFVVGRDGDRTEVIRRYRVWLWAEMRKEGIVFQEIKRLLEIWQENGNIALLCYCFPKPCHAQIIGCALIWLDGVLAESLKDVPY